jgi:hypothetical protein
VPAIFFDAFVIGQTSLAEEHCLAEQIGSFMERNKLHARMRSRFGSVRPVGSLPRWWTAK